MALTVEIVAPDRVVWSGRAQRVVAPSVEGEIGLLTGHEPVLSVLRAGRVAVVDEAGARSEFRVTGGFVSLDHDSVTVVADAVAVESV